MTYSTRPQAVSVGKTRRDVLVAAFRTSSGAEVLFQLADEGGLRRGGTYVLAPGADAALAPRFDEMFRDVAAKAADVSRRPAIRKLVRRAEEVARATSPRLTPQALADVERLATACGRLSRRRPMPGWPLDLLSLVLALIFASEEERYPRPRYKGCGVAVGRILELVR